MRRSHDRRLGKSALHLVGAGASINHLLGQVKVDEKTNEIMAIPALLEMLASSGCIATIDAIGTQKEIAWACVRWSAAGRLPSDHSG